MKSFLFYFLLTTSFAYFVWTCIPNPKGQLKALQSLYKNTPCIQCDVFNIDDSSNCPNFDNTLVNATCGLLISSFSLTARHCAVASMSCVPKTLGNVAFWGVSLNNSKVTIISEPNEISAALPLVCNNESVWQISNSSEFSLFDTKDSSKELPSEYAAGGFTLHCISSKNLTLVDGAKEALTTSSNESATTSSTTETQNVNDGNLQSNANENDTTVEPTTVAVTSSVAESVSTTQSIEKVNSSTETNNTTKDEAVANAETQVTSSNNEKAADSASLAVNTSKDKIANDLKTQSFNSNDEVVAKTETQANSSKDETADVSSNQLVNSKEELVNVVEPKKVKLDGINEAPELNQSKTSVNAESAAEASNLNF